MTRNREELTIFVERYMHFMNLWTIYSDLLTGRYVPSINPKDDPNKSAYQTFLEPRTTVMLILYAYFYSLVEDSSDGINAFRVWREHFPEEEEAIAALEKQIRPMTKDLKIYRNRLGFHGSRSEAHQARAFDFFASTTGTAAWDAIVNFKGLSAAFLAKDIALSGSDEAELLNCAERIKSITTRVKQQLGS